MSAEAAIADVCDAVVAPSAAATALMVVDGGFGEATQVLLGAALRADLLIIDVELLASDKTPWVGAGTPGSADGCVLGPGDARNRIRVRTDRGAVFLASNIDLILRSNGISTIVLADDEPYDFVAAINTTLVTRGYHIVTSATSAEATTHRDGVARRSQQPPRPAAGRKSRRPPVEPRRAHRSAPRRAGADRCPE